ncbi:PREDICTED: B3 domain-containing protein REM16-like isoform X1 [Lupinus angustifolius]|uniref:B3 domain-containing protein REM16-like isoform X1 n=1 Tax=Lupinus angustifolius TaxID=3871 RepID=UPI00092FD94D|nr:PREDICTED: B3 domain-containing protein REM16-like isoform X1 [Lupinus angustifolius]
MRGKGDENSRLWVEDIYWTHFKALHFAQFLRTGYDQHLVLPKTFSDNVKKLPENVDLRGPSGVVWNVGLTSKDDTVFFTNGWRQFFRDHSLKENDFLVFKYNGESLFDVLIFDGGSFCEKASSYFVRKCGYTENGGACLITGEVADNSVQKVNAPSNAGVQFASPEKSVDGNDLMVFEAVPFKTPTERTFNAGVESASPEQFMEADGVAEAAAVSPQTTGKRTRKQLYAVKPIRSVRRGRAANVPSANQEVVDLVTVIDPKPASGSKSRTRDISYTSNRRPVTEDEIKNALELAKAACTSGSLHIVMRPTHVYKRFYVSIPNKWIFEHMPQKSQNVILRVGGTEWLAKYSLHNIRLTGGLTGGWKHFALDNNLEEFDVCVLEPAGQINNALILDVSIFRVVQEITPLGMVGTPGIRGRKK